MAQTMEMLTEESNINDFLNELEKNYELKPDFKISVVEGSELDPKLFEPGIKASLKELKSQTGANYPSDYNQIDPHKLYVLIFKEKADQNEIYMVMPYGINISNILINTLIDKPKNQNWTKAQLKANLQKLYEDNVSNIVMQQFFKFYMPANRQVPNIPDDLLEHVKYQGLKSNDFNLVMSFVVPLNDLYDPLKQAIIRYHDQTDHKIDYNQISLAPIQALNYEPKTKMVTVVTTLL